MPRGIIVQEKKWIGKEKVTVFGPGMAMRASPTDMSCFHLREVKDIFKIGKHVLTTDVFGLYVYPPAAQVYFHYDDAYRVEKRTAFLGRDALTFLKNAPNEKERRNIRLGCLFETYLHEAYAIQQDFLTPVLYDQLQELEEEFTLGFYDDSMVRDAAYRQFAMPYKVTVAAYPLNVDRNENAARNQSCVIDCSYEHKGEKKNVIAQIETSPSDFEKTLYETRSKYKNGHDSGAFARALLLETLFYKEMAKTRHAMTEAAQEQIDEILANASAQIDCAEQALLRDAVKRSPCLTPFLRNGE